MKNGDAAMSDGEPKPRKTWLPPTPAKSLVEKYDPGGSIQVCSHASW